MGFGEERKMGKRWCDIDTQWTHYYIFGVLTYVPVLAKIDQEMRPWECPYRRTHWRTHTDTL